MSLITLLIAGSANTCFYYQQPHHCCPWAPGAWAALTNEEHSAEAPKHTHLCFASSQLLTIKLSTPDSMWNKDKSFILDLSAGKATFALLFFFFLSLLTCFCITSPPSALFLPSLSHSDLPSDAVQFSLGLAAAWDVTLVWQAWCCCFSGLPGLIMLVMCTE